MKRHIENLQGRLLKEIYLRYSSRSGTSLNSFIKKELKESDGDFELTKNIKKDLEELETRGLLTWDAEPMEKKGGNFPESKKYRDLLGTTGNFAQSDHLFSVEPDHLIPEQTDQAFPE